MSDVLGNVAKMEESLRKLKKVHNLYDIKDIHFRTPKGRVQKPPAH